MTPLLALAHLAVPWALRLPLPSGALRGPIRFVRGRSEEVYTAATLGLGAVALLLSGAGPPGQATAWTPVVSVIAVALGAGLPLAMAALVRRPRRFARFPGRPVRIVLCATAEEALWRLAALGGLVYAGMPLLAATMVTVGGFALLHVPRDGLRVVYYQLLLGTAFTVLALLGGVVAAALCHCAHNLVMASTTRAPRRPVAAAPSGLPSSRPWGG